MEKLTKTEEPIMQIMWKLKKGLVRDVMQALGPPEPKYTTISSLMRILVDKGFLGYKAYGRTHEYFIAISKADYRKFVMQDMLSGYFEGNPHNLVSYLVEEEELNDDLLKELRQLLNASKNDN